MDSNQIDKILSSYPRIKNCFIGVCSCNTIFKPSAHTPPYCFVCNTARSNEPGEHWVAFYVPDNSCVEFFDSYGAKPLIPEFKKFVSHFPKLKYNKTVLQGVSTQCGEYCVLFLIARQYGHTIDSITSRFHAGENSLIRDITVCSIVNTLAGLKLPLLDPQLL